LQQQDLEMGGSGIEKAGKARLGFFLRDAWEKLLKPRLRKSFGEYWLPWPKSLPGSRYMDGITEKPWKIQGLNGARCCF